MSSVNATSMNGLVPSAGKAIDTGQLHSWLKLGGGTSLGLEIPLNGGTGDAKDSKNLVPVLVRWLDQEVVGRLAALDKKLDEVRAESRNAKETQALLPVMPVSSDSSRLRNWETASKSSRGSDEGVLCPRSAASSRMSSKASMGKRLAEMLSANIKPPVRKGQNPIMQQIWATVDDPQSSSAAQAYFIAMPSLIMLSVCVTLLQTIDDSPLRGLPAAIIETSFDSVFTIDVLIRFVACPQKVPFFLNAHSILDTITGPVVLSVRSLAGFVIPLDKKHDSPYSLLLHLVPVLRMLKVIRGFRRFNLIVQAALKVYVETLPTFLFILLVMQFFSMLIYFAEPRENIESYPKAMWFIIITMTTVGYGDVSPTTGAGYCIMSVMASSSVFVMAMPLGIIGQSVAEIWKDRHRIIFATWVRGRLSQWGYTANDIPSLFKQFDPVGNGEITYEKFLLMTNDMQIGLSEDRVYELFQFFDEDGGGTIDADEFLRKIYPDEYAKREREIQRQGSKRSSQLTEAGGEVINVQPATAGSRVINVVPCQDSGE
eukprot:gnl/TRDRNA2_/TRDRNA2_28023_c0_seq1.p1 gnl/TRDRNA2_/TRDRNA2_28023_c0~~gnl/TRDRNA2_/TRDRNA2_28023_c0_seq1.p1  ORF type:complete len:542 (+),score=87.73 gnl/TRDRNA2_/TRDRNA2_28023_c0_seq1:90-1715(+)